MGYAEVFSFLGDVQTLQAVTPAFLLLTNLH